MRPASVSPRAVATALQIPLPAATSMACRSHPGRKRLSAAGPALLNYSAANGSVYPNRLDLISNRDQFHYQGDLQVTPHLLLLGGFHFENERADEREPVYFISESSASPITTMSLALTATLKTGSSTRFAAASSTTS